MHHFENTHSAAQQINHSIDSNTSLADSQIVIPTNSNVFIDTSVILSCLENIIGNIENGGDDELSSTSRTVSSFESACVLINCSLFIARIKFK